MARQVLIGQTDYSVLVFIPDSAQTDGSGKTGLVAANLTAGYTRVETDNDVVHTDGTSSLNNLAALTSAHTDWGWLEVSNTLAPGLYRLDLPDGIFATGAWSAVLYVMVTTSAASPSPMEFVLVGQDPQATSVNANVVAISGDTTAADNAETAFDGGAYNVGGGAVVAASVTGAVGSVGAGGIAATSFAAGAIDAAAIAASAIGASEIADNAITAAKVADGAIDAATFASGAITADAIAANAIGSSELAQSAAQEIADEILDRDLAGGASGDTRNVRNALRSLRNRVAISAGTATIYAEDDATPAWTATVSTAAGDPISEVDPA